jgi:hypothetical protein
MLFNGWVVLFTTAALTLLLFVTGQWSVSGLHWNGDHVKCFEKKHWDFDDWHTLVALGKLEWRYRPANYDCTTKYDPDQFKVNDPSIDFDKAIN